MAETDQGVETLSLDEFGKKYGWKNDPSRVGRLDLDSPEASVPAPRSPTPEAVAAADPMASLRVPEPLRGKPGDPLAKNALVARPATLPGVRSWTLETRHPRGYCSGLAFSPDGRLIATSSGEGKSVLWDPSTGKAVRFLVTPAIASYLCWSPDSKYLALSGSGGVNLWHVESGRLVRTHGGAPWPAGVSWSPDGRWLLLGCRGGSSPETSKHGPQGIRILDLRANDPPIVLRDAPETEHVAWAPDGKSFAAGPGPITIWEFPALRRRQQLPCADLRQGIRWSPDGRFLAADPGARTAVWDVATGKRPPGTPAELDDGNLFAWYPQGCKLTFRSRSDGVYCLWDADHPGTFVLPKSDPINASRMAWSPDGTTLARIRDYRDVELYRKTTGWRSSETVTPRITAVAFSPDGRTLAYAGHVETHVGAHLWTLASSQPPRSLPTPAHGQYYNLAWSADGKTLAGRWPGKLIVWDVPSGAQATTFDCPGSEGGSIALSPDGQRLASNCGTLAVFDRKTRTPIWKASPGGTAVAWSPDGRRLAAGTGPEVAIFDPDSGKRLTTIAPAGEKAAVVAMLWSPDGKQLVAQARGSAPGLWDVASARLLRQLAAPDGDPVDSFEWLDGGKTLVLSSGKSIVLTDFASGRRIREHKYAQLGSPTVSPDGRLSAFISLGAISVHRTSDFDRSSTLLWLADGTVVRINPEGHFAGPPGVEKELVYVVQTEAGARHALARPVRREVRLKNDPAKALRPAADAQSAP